MLWVKITTLGKQTHGSTPQSGINAFVAASHLVVALRDLYKKFNKKDRLFADVPYSTFEATKKEANVPNVNTIPGEDVFYLDCRILPCYSNNQVLAEIKKHIKAVEKKFKVKIKLDVLVSESSKPTAKNHDMVKLLLAGIKEVYHNRPTVQGLGGGTVAAYLRNAGFPAVVYSKLDETMHQPNEYASIKNTIGDAKIFAAVAMRLK